MVESSHAAGWMPNFYEPLRNIGRKVADWFSPPSEASVSKQHYEISVELPGVKPEDVEVSVLDNSLVIRGEKRSEREHKDRTYYFSERTYGSFQRTFRLPPDADQDDVTADFSNGVLVVQIAKKGAKQTSTRKIEVRTG